MQLMALGASNPAATSGGLWQSQLAAVAARQLNSEPKNSTNLGSGLPPPPPLTSIQPQVNDIQAIQQALQQQQQNIQQHLQNLLLLQQSANSLGNISSNNNVPPPFMGNQVRLNSYRRCSICRNNHFFRHYKGC